MCVECLQHTSVMEKQAMLISVYKARKP